MGEEMLTIYVLHYYFLFNYNTTLLCDHYFSGFLIRVGQITTYKHSLMNLVQLSAQDQM